MKQLEQARVLLAKALEDERAAAALSGCEGISHSIIGFHCQQAAEKLLKAFLSARSVAFRHTHNLSALIGGLEQSGYGFPDELRKLEELTRFAVEFRYDLLEEHLGFDRQAALELVRRLRGLVESEIAKAGT
ncbi:MAG: HEPN domain-containing protein [Candidatus Brocadiia bacterium]